MSKTLIYLGASIGGILGGIIGSKLDNGNIIGVMSIILSTVGGIFGIYIAYKVQQ